ncbi:MAG: Ig-like domain repeat protein, partial [Gammaproteobacteria bacterium]|nr:Ig-like domain repeat protein [Gammaproteobacteria bacterium]
VSLLDAGSNLKRVVGPISVRTDIIAPGSPLLVFPNRIALDAAGSIKVVDGLNPPSTFTQDQITLVAKTDALFHGKSGPYLSASASQLRVSVGGTEVVTLPKDISNVGPGGTIQIVIPKSVFGGQKGSLLATAQLIDQAGNQGPLVTSTIVVDIDKPIVPDLAEPEIKDGGITCRGLGPIINSDHSLVTITAKTVVMGDTLAASLSGVSNVSFDTRPLALSNDFTLPEINSPKPPATPNAVIRAQTFRGTVVSSIVSKGFFIDTVKPLAPTPTLSCANTTPTSPCDLVFKLQDQDDKITFTTGGLKCTSSGAMANCLNVAANETLDYIVEDWACNQVHSSYTLTPSGASATRVKFTATPTSIPSGSPVTLSTEVTGDGGPGKEPTGQVSFTEGANLLGTVVLDNSSRGSVTAILTGTGDHSITARYEGDKNNQSSVASAVVTVTPQALSPTQSLLSPSTTSLIEGTSLILTGTVQTASNNGIAPSGTLTFSEGATPLGTSTLDRNQKANISLTNLSAGTHIFIVSYSGDSLYSPSLSPPVTVTVTTSRSNTQTLLTASKLNLVSTETLTLKAQVSQSTPNGHLPSGLVTFQGSNGRTNTAALDALGEANISGVAFTPGTYTITASYPGDIYNQPSTSNTLTLTVTNPQTTSTTSLTAAPATVQQGTPVIFTAHVSGNTVVGQFPTGNVSFTEGNITLANGSLDANQNATFTTSQLTPGTHLITASYPGDTSNAARSSNTPITLTAFVSGFQNTQGPTPTGSVTFFDGNTQIQTVPLNNGVASIQKPFSSGRHTLGASYTSTNGYAPSSTQGIILIIP